MWRSTIASDAGPQCSGVCAMNGTALSSTRARRSAGGAARSAAVCGGVHAQPATATASSAAASACRERFSGSNA
jgi:hypothetical protein